MLADPRQVVSRAWCSGLMPDPDLTVSEWADERRILSNDSGSAEPGPWRTSRTPYLKDIMDDLSPASPFQKVVFMKGSQIGGSEAGNNWIGYVIDHAPGPMLLIQPSVTLAENYTTLRLQPMFDITPSIKEKMAEAKSRDAKNTQTFKSFKGGVLVAMGANAPSPLRSMPMRYLFCDEVDAYPGDVGGEGDPVNLAEVRTRTFGRRRKIFKVSSPTISGQSRIETDFEDTDRRFYEVPCPDCGTYQVIKWANIKYENDDPKTVYLQCECCEYRIKESHKPEMLEQGKWVPQNPGARYRGYHLSALYSPLGWYSWEQAVEDWLDIKRTKSQSKLKVFTNTVLGETWMERGEAPEWEKLYNRVEPYKENCPPSGVFILTAGVDVQKDRIECEVVGWGRNYESWSISYRVIHGDTTGHEVWSELFSMLNETWVTEDGLTLKLTCMGIDTGYNTQRVYSAIRESKSERVYAFKGMDRMSALVGHPKDVDIKHNGHFVARGLKLWPVGVDIAKTELYDRLRLERNRDAPIPQGFCHFPEYGEEYFMQLTAEQKKGKMVKGYKRWFWEKIRDRNEALDCRVYARACAFVAGLDRFTPEHWDRLSGQLEAEREAAKQGQKAPQTGLKRRKTEFL